MTQKIILWSVIVYVLVLTFSHIKIVNCFEAIFLKDKINLLPESKRAVGWMLGFVLLLPIRPIAPELAPISYYFYGFVSIIWSTVYSKFIARDEDAN